METIWAFVIIITASLQPVNVNGDILGGRIDNTTTIYFATEEACNNAHREAIAHKEEIAASMYDAEVEIFACEGLKIAE